MGNQILIIAHRGASAYEPENTLPAINKALELGAKWIEIDVHKCENNIIVIHDHFLFRRTNGRGFVSGKSLEYIRSLDAGNGAVIPLLTEVIDLTAGKSGLNIELKGKETAEPVAQILLKYIKDGICKYEDFILSSFNYNELRKIKSLDRKFNTAVLTRNSGAKALNLSTELGAKTVHVYYRFIKKKFVEKAHELGIKVYTYTVNDPKICIKLKSIGVDGVFSDYPDLLHRQ